MEIEEQQNSKAQAEQEVSDKQAEISASEEDRTNLEDYREILLNWKSWLHNIRIFC